MNNNQRIMTSRAFAAGLLAAALAAGTSGVCLAQTSEYYLHAGDQDTFTVIQNGAIVRQWGLAPGTSDYQYPMAVRDTIRTTGANVSDTGAEYSLTGQDLGTRYVHPSGTSRCWDGATNGTHFFTIDTAGAVWQFDDDWTNPVFLFSAGGIGALAYDPDNNSLWIGTFSGATNLTQYDLSGNVISSFSTGHTQNMAVALDPADGTLWIHNRNVQGTFEQWSRTGQLLQTTAVPGMSGQNALSGEFRFGGGAYTCTITGPCPGTVRISWSNAPANTQQGIVFARNTGNFTIPGGPCQGTQLGLGTNQLQLVNTVGTGNGSGAVNGQAGAGACGGFIQLVALDTPCKTSNVVQVP